MTKYLTYGLDQLRKQEFLIKAKEKFAQKYSSINIDQIYFDSKKLSVQDLQAKLQAMPFLGSKRMIIIHQPIASNIRAKKKLEKIIEQLIAVPESTFLIINEAELKNRTVINKLQKAGFSLKEFKPVYGYQLEGWVKERVQGLGLIISGQELTKLINLLGNDSSRIDQELTKLRDYLAYNHKKEITDDAIDQVIVPTPKVAIFDLLDNLIKKDLALASQYLEDMLDSGVSESYLISMLEMTLSNLIMAKDYSERTDNLTASGLQKKFGWHPFMAQKIFQQIHSLNKKSLIKFYQRLLETEINIKTGFSKPRLELTLLLSQL